MTALHSDLNLEVGPDHNFLIVPAVSESISLITNGGLVASCGPAACSSSQLVAPTRLSRPTCTHAWRRSPLFSSQVTASSRIQVEQASSPMLANNFPRVVVALAAMTRSVPRRRTPPRRNLVFALLLCIGPRPVFALQIPRVALAGSLVGTTSTRNTPGPLVRIHLRPERCAHCLPSCIRSALQG